MTRPTVNPGPFDRPEDLTAELWRRAVPYMLFACGFIAGVAVLGSLASWGWW